MISASLIPATVTVSVTATPERSPALGEVLNAASGSVGRIITSYCDELPTAGSGFVVADDLVLTAAHMATGASAMTIEFPDQDPVALELVYSEPAQDAALLRLVEPASVRPLTLSEDNASTGDQVGVLGYPLGFSAIHVNPGMVSSVDDDADIGGYTIDDVLTLDAAVNPGNSGGPVLSSNGDVVGLISASASYGGVEDATAEGIHFAIPADRLLSILADWADSPSESPAQCEEPMDNEATDAPILELLNRSEGEETDALAATLWMHGEAINQSQYEAAWELFSPDMKARQGGVENWSAGLDTTYWVILEIRDVAVDDDRVLVRIFLRTYQDSIRGPDRQTCSIWPLTYTMIRSGSAWLIDRAEARAAPQACQR